jgi:transposase-like protein
MGKAEKKRRVYTKEFKAEAVALAEKREKPVIQVAQDLGISDTVLHRWMHLSGVEHRTPIRGLPGIRPAPHSVLRWPV